MAVTANWLEAAKRTPSSPTVVVEIESGTGTVLKNNLVSDWNASSSQIDCDVFTRGDGTGGVRPKLYTYNQNSAQLAWKYGSIVESLYFDRTKYNSVQLTAPTRGFFESITGILYCDITPSKPLFVIPEANAQLVNPSLPDIQGKVVTLDTAKASSIKTAAPVTLILGHGRNSNWLGKVNGDQPISAGAVWWPGYTSDQPVSVLNGSYPVLCRINAAIVSYHIGLPNPPNPNPWTSIDYRQVGPIQIGIVKDSNFALTYRAEACSFTSKTFDLGTTPTNASVVNIKSSTPGKSRITITGYTSPNGSAWTSIGTVRDGQSIAAARYYRFAVAMVCTVDAPGALKVPELYEIRITGGNAQFDYYSSDSAISVPGYVVKNHLKSVSGISAKIGLKDKPTVGDLSITLNWLKEVSEMAAGTQRKRSIRVYLGFVGLAWTDYAPYFTGVWDSLSCDDSKREIIIKVRDVWKLFKKKIPDVYFSKGKITTEAYRISGNIIDAIVETAEKTAVPDRFMDSTAFDTLRDSQFATGNWTVLRDFTEQVDADTIMNELAVSAGVFLVPGNDGKLRPVHYDSVIAAAVSATLDAGRYKFSDVTTDFGETITQTRIFYGIQAGKSGSSATDYSSVYLDPNPDAEIDRDEVVPMEWLDKFGLGAGDEKETSTALTKLSDRFMSWYCPTATINGKVVAIAAYKTTVTGLPLYFFDLTPGKTVAVDNLRLPAALAQWGGYSSGTRFLIMSQKVDTKNWTISLDLRQVGPISYKTVTNWFQYQHDIIAAALPTENHYFIDVQAVVTGLGYELGSGQVRIFWNPVIGGPPVTYEIQTGTVWDAAENTILAANLNGNSYTWITSQTGTLRVMVKAVDPDGNYTLNPALLDIVVPVPVSVTGLGLTESLYATNTPGEIKSRAVITWTPGDATAVGYDVDVWGPVDSTWSPQGRVTKPTFTLDDTKPGWWKVQVRPVNTYGIPGAWIETQQQLQGKTAPPANVTGLGAVVTRGQIRLYWDPVSDLDVAGYEIQLGTNWDAGGNIKLVQDYAGTSYPWTPNVTGTISFLIKAIDTTGHYSTTALRFDLTVSNPNPVTTFTQKVIDNIVELRWTPGAASTFPIDYYELYKGADFATAQATGFIGRKYGTFDLLSETVGGTFKYWVVAVDIAGLKSSEVGVYAKVDQPPDYVLQDQQNIILSSATLVNSLAVGSKVVVLVNTTETFQSHFTSRGWDQPSDQTGSGYLVYAQPGMSTASIEKVVDYGAVIPGCKISMSVTRATLGGTVTVTPQISISTDNSNWTVVTSTDYEIFTTSFRYVKYRLNFSTANGGVAEVSQIAVKLDVKQRTAVMKMNVADTVSDGTQVTFSSMGIAPVDVVGIIAEAPYTANASNDPIKALINFVDIPYPTSFKVLAWNKSGTRIAVNDVVVTVRYI